MSDASGLNLYQRIRAVALEVTKVDKTGKTQFGGKATSIGDVENALRGPMFEYGIITHWSEPELMDMSRTTANGKVQELWKARMSVTVVNADKPEEQFEDYWSDIGASPLAATSLARKGYYKALFHLTGDEDEGPKQSSQTGKSTETRTGAQPQNGNAAADDDPVNVERDGLLKRVGEALKVLSERRKTTGKKLMTEWMNETSVKVKGWDAMNNKQLTDLLDWINKQLQPATPQGPQYTDEQLHAMSEQSKALAARTHFERYTPEQLENMPDAAKQEARRAQEQIEAGIAASATGPTDDSMSF